VRAGGTNDALQGSHTMLTGGRLLFDSLSQASRSREHEVKPVLGAIKARLSLNISGFYFGAITEFTSMELRMRT